MNPIPVYKHRKWQRWRNDNDAYLDDINPVIVGLNAVIASPGITTVLPP